MMEDFAEMFMDVIHSCKKLPGPKDFYRGLELPKNFAFPDNILMFAHDWHPEDWRPPTDRHKLIIPAVPLVYEVWDTEEQYEIKPGCAFFLRGCQKWRLRKTHPDLQHGYLRMIITFEAEADQFYLPDKEIFQLTPRAETRLETLYNAFAGQHPVDCSIALFELLCELSSHQLTILPKSMSLPVKRAVRYINTTPCRTDTLKEIAACAKTSVSNLRWRFRRETGTSIGRFMLEHRLKVAFHYLAKTNVPMEELAEICGFKTVHSFYHFFTRNAGISPGRYRRENRDS